MDVAEAIKLLPEDDVEFLASKFPDCEIVRAGGQTWVTIQKYALSAKYTPQVTRVRVVVPAAYPIGLLDMFWTFPIVQYANGSAPPQTETRAPFPDSGDQWQRWSRHPHQWRPGIDNLRSFFAVIAAELKQAP